MSRLSGPMPAACRQIGVVGMKISTKGRYALLLMGDLARAQKGELTPIKEIANHQGISEKYLEQIVRSLAKEGLVLSTRGSQGGYRLAADPSSITVGAILRATEGDLAPVSCVADGGFCNHLASCETVFIWRKIKEAVDEVVDGITLPDLVEQASASEPAFELQA